MLGLISKPLKKPTFNYRRLVEVVKVQVSDI